MSQINLGQNFESFHPHQHNQCFNPDFGPKNPPTVKLNSRKNCFSFKDRDTNLIISLRENKTSPDNAESQNIV